MTDFDDVGPLNPAFIEAAEEVLQHAREIRKGIIHRVKALIGKTHTTATRKDRSECADTRQEQGVILPNSEDLGEEKPPLM